MKGIQTRYEAVHFKQLLPEMILELWNEKCCAGAGINSIFKAVLKCDRTRGQGLPRIFLTSEIAARITITQDNEGYIVPANSCIFTAGPR